MSCSAGDGILSTSRVARNRMGTAATSTPSRDWSVEEVDAVFQIVTMLTTLGGRWINERHVAFHKVQISAQMARLGRK